MASENVTTNDVSWSRRHANDLYGFAAKELMYLYRSDRGSSATDPEYERQAFLMRRHLEAARRAAIAMQDAVNTSATMRKRKSIDLHLPSTSSWVPKRNRSEADIRGEADIRVSQVVPETTTNLVVPETTTNLVVPDAVPLDESQFSDTNLVVPDALPLDESQFPDSHLVVPDTMPLDESQFPDTQIWT